MQFRTWVRLAALGAAWAAAETLNVAAAREVELDAPARRALWAHLPMWLGLAVLGGAGAALLSTWALARLGRRLDDAGRALLARGQLATYWPLGLAVGTGLGVFPHLGPLGHLALWALSTLTLAFVAQRWKAPPPTRWGQGLAVLFFGSGAAALIYQVVWQRTLGAFYGTNIESATMVVSIFMLGLGLGSLLGARLSERFPRHAAELFLFIELGIGGFGALSLWLIRSVGAATVHAPFFAISAAVLGVLLIPTLLMGATLPILVAHINRSLKNVGLSVAHLYALNALGSALACFLTGNSLFAWLGQSGSVLVAAACNFAVGTLVYRFIRQTRGVAA